MKTANTGTQETKVCNRCGGDPKPMSAFRTHKTGYVLNQCKECERAAATARRQNRTGTFEVQTKSGVAYTVSLAPVPGSRKVSSPRTDKVLYIMNANRDQARSAFANYANVPYTGINTPIV